MASCRKHPGTIIAVAESLAEAVSRLEFSVPVTHVYNPLRYAWAAHRQYLERYGASPELEVVLLGMNPGPWGMAQTGVPFGEVGVVRDWLGIDAEIGRPEDEHPKRPVTGLDCHRSEVSGQRLWGWARDQFGTPEEFFRRFFVANYCPLMFLEASGRNRTPDRLPVAEREPLIVACDEALRRLVEVSGPRHVVGVGRFAEQRARRALSGLPVQIGRILHPSPASPAANRDWRGQAMAELAGMGIGLG
jgi:single-strand selective monofunctional uracil DNA glycosylase